MNLADLIALASGIGLMCLAVHQLRSGKFYYKTFLGTSKSGSKSKSPVIYWLSTIFQFLMAMLIIWASITHNVSYRDSILRDFFTTPVF